MNFRNLIASEIECRVATVSEKGLSLLLYKDARCDMALLDETVGCENWQRKHYECKGNLFCSVGIKIENEWIWKDDCGSESYTEKEKGEASDSFKRACFNWGIGRELYTSPFIWVSAVDSNNIINYQTFKRGDKIVTNDKFILNFVKTENKEIKGLSIDNRNLKKSIFKFGNVNTEKYFCLVCKKEISKAIYEGSMQANRKAYCSGTCKKTDTNT